MTTIYGLFDPRNDELRYDRKLSDSQIREIHRRSGAGETSKSLSLEFGVGEETVRRVKNKIGRVNRQVLGA